MNVCKPVLDAIKKHGISDATITPFGDLRTLITADPSKYKPFEEDFFNSGGFELLLKLFESKKPLDYDAAMVILNCTVCRPLLRLREALGCSAVVIQSIVSNLSTTRSLLLFSESPVFSISINNLSFISSPEKARDILITNGALKGAVDFLESKVHPINYKLGAILTIANLVGTSETKHHKSLAASEEILEAVLTGLKTGFYNSNVRWRASNMFPAFRRLSVNDQNKAHLVKMRVVPVLLTKLTEEEVIKDEITVSEILEMLLNLSLLDENKDKLLADNVPAKLTEFNATKYATPDHKKAIAQILWKLEKEDKPTAAAPSSPSTSASAAASSPSAQEPVVMISYNWDNQPIVVEIVKHLTAQGVKVWLDLNEMMGSTIEAMASAVESARVVLVCLSRKYKESANCRLEAEYAFKKKRVIIPLMMQPGYDADGWLGAIVGTKLWYDFTQPAAPSKGSIDNLMKELKKHLVLASVATPPLVAIPTAAPPAVEQPRASQWSYAQVGEWLTTIGISQPQVRVFEEQHIDGNALAGLAEAIKQRSPKWAQESISPGGVLGFAVIGDSLKFLHQLNKLQF